MQRQGGIEAVRVDAGDVPGLLFAPDQPGPLPLVLLGHGAHLGKDVDVMQILCRSFARAVPAAVLVIDCPGHGERRPPGLDDAGFERLVHRQMGSAASHDQLVGDWTAAAAAARSVDARIDHRTAYAGFSMGSIFGASIVHRLPFVGPVVLALGGFVAAHRNGGVNDLIQAGLPRLGDREVLMLNMTRDESFPIADALRAFALIPGPKRMAVYEGGHVDIPGEAIRVATEFLRRTLTVS